MRYRWLIAAVLAVLTAAVTPARADKTDDYVQFDPLLRRLESSFALGDEAAYLENFSNEMREAERDTFNIYSEKLGLKRMELRVSGSGTEAGGRPTVFVQAHFSGGASVYIEFWILTLTGSGEDYSIAGRSMVGSLGPLYRLSLPSGEAVRAERVEVVNEDIRAVFENASVFSDALPDRRSVMVIVGRGSFRFTPSDEGEKHQLKLVYGKEELEDGLHSLYIRASPEFLDSHVKLLKAAGGVRPPPADLAEAGRAFNRNYPRSFTVENPLSGEVLSFLPQGDESVFELDSSRQGELAYIFSPFSDEEVNLYDRTRKRMISLYNPAREGGDPGTRRMFIRYADKFDVESYDISVDYRPAQTAMSARAGIHIKANTDNLANVRLHFNPDFRISSISDEQGRRLFYTVDRNRAMLYVYFNKPMKKDSRSWIDVVYSGRIVPPLPLTDNIGQSEADSRSVFRPKYDNFLFTRSGLWYPAPDENDFFNCRLRVSVPSAYSCVALGLPAGDGEGPPMFPDEEFRGAGTGTFSFTSGRPVKYVSFMVGRFDLIKRASDPLPMEMYVSNGVMDRKPQIFEQARAIVGSFSRAFGTYPFEKLGLVLRSWPVSGGFSPPSYVVLNDVPWHTERGRADLSGAPVSLPRYSDFFLAHEIAHQWWGQGVSCAGYKEQWLSEGLAQYAAVSYIREEYGRDAYLSAIRKFSKWVEKKSSMGPVLMGARLSSLDHDAYQAIVYDKAAMVMFILEDLIGRETVLAGLKDYFEVNRGRAARTGDLVRSMEKAAGRSLAAFFDQWLGSYELPRVRAIWSEERTADGYVVKLRTDQFGKIFEFPLTVQWSEAGKVRTESIVVDGASREFTWAAAGKPSKFRTDPDGLIPGRFD